jgi:hypothetical protein
VLRAAVADGLRDQLGTQIQAGTADEHGVVRDDGELPPDRSGSDPQVGVVVPLVQCMADHSAVIAEFGNAFDRLVVDWQQADAIDQARKLVKSSLTPPGH